MNDSRTRLVVLGAGRVGAAMALDLAADRDLAVTVADRSSAALAPLAARGLACVEVDLADREALARLVAGHDLVVGAVPGFMGYSTAQTVIECGKNLVDISFFPEDALALDELARRQGVTAVVDCGVAPGLSNLILGELARRLERVERFVCYVGGLPVVRTWPYEYKAPFSPIDVLEEYVRPARYVAHGRIVTMPALSEPELLDFPGLGTLEAFNTDGLRSLLRTMEHVPFMKEMTLRYPGHIEKMRMLRESGFFGTEPIAVGDVAVRPLDLTARLLFPLWQFAEGEEDFTVMQVVVEGERDGHRERYVYDLLDRTDHATGTLSMARTTGYTCTAGARLVARGQYRVAGISPPELLPRQPGCFDRVLADLAARGVTVRSRVEAL